MRDTLITLAGALLSLFILVSVMSPQTGQQIISKPNTEDAGKHGLKALHTWLLENNINTHSLRKPVTRIDQEALPATGNLMVVSLPLAREALDSEWSALNKWISNGNTAIVLASLYHMPPWSNTHQWVREPEIRDAVAGLTAEEFTLQRDVIDEGESEFSLADMQESIQAVKPQPYWLYPAVDHSLFSGVYELESMHTPGVYQYRDELDNLRASYWSIDSDAARLALRVIYGETQDQTAMWLLPIGKGWIYLSAFPDLVSNGVLRHKQNARWFANLLSHAVTDGGYVIFNDYHFGLSDLYDPDAFFADYRLHNTLFFIGAFWLIYALGRSPRLAPVREQTTRPANRDFIEAMAGFFTRRIRPRAIAHELATRLVDDISNQTQLKGDSLWNWLHDHPDISEHDILRLQRASGQASGRTKLMQLTRSISRIQKVLI
jgi:hypothetical protein